MKIVKTKRFQHLKHVDEVVLREKDGVFRIRLAGWVLCSETEAPQRVWAEFARSKVEAVRCYRPDVLALPGGRCREDYLAGFTLEMTVPSGDGRLVLFAENREGRAAPIWNRKLRRKDFNAGRFVENLSFSGYEFITRLALHPVGAEPPERDPNEAPLVECIIPDFKIGAGGHAAIFRILKGCEDAGWRTRLWILFSSSHGSDDEVRAVLARHFQPLRSEVRFLTAADVGEIDGEIGLATDRWTAYFLRAANRVSRKYYLVQDWEPLFYPTGTASLLAANTYQFPFTFFASTPWLRELLEEQGHRDVTVFRYGVNREKFFPPPTPRRNALPRIAFYSRASTERRAVELGLMALEILHSRGVEFLVDFFGYDMAGFAAPYRSVDHGVIGEDGLGELFRAVDIGLVFSATNPSIITGEMMACGLAVVELDTRNNRASWPEDVAAWTAPDPAIIADRLEELVTDAEAREGLGARALAHSATLSWDNAVRPVVEKLARDRGEKA